MEKKEKTKQNMPPQNWKIQQRKDKGNSKNGDVNMIRTKKNPKGMQ